MTKRELVAAIARRTRKPEHEIRDIINETFAVITETVANDDYVMITNFGRFDRQWSETRTGTNPRTGDPIKIDGHHRPMFRPADNFRNTVNQ